MRPIERMLPGLVTLFVGYGLAMHEFVIWQRHLGTALVVVGAVLTFAAALATPFLERPARQAQGGEGGADS